MIVSRSIQIFAIILAFVILASCAGLQGEKKPSVVSAPPPAPMDKQIFERRIRELDNIIESNKIDTSQKVMARRLIGLYKKLAQGEYTEESADLIDTLIMLDKAFFTTPPVPPQPQTCISLFSEKVETIKNAFLGDDYDKVIDLVLELKRIFGPDALVPDVALVFALTLEKKGMIKEAAEIGERLMARIEGSPTKLTLMNKLVVWHLALQQRQLAIKNYEKAKRLVSQEQETLQKLDSIINTTDQTSFEKAGESKPSPIMGLPLHEFLVQIDNLLEQYEFDRARDLLAARRNISKSEGELERLKEKGLELEQREDEFIKQRIRALSKEKNNIQRAKKLLEQEKYESALALLDSVLKDNPHSGEALRLKEDTVECIINRERNKAARLFLFARNTRDRAKKEEYLRQSLEILKALVEKYPLSPLINKVKSHINRVKEEIDRLG